MGTGYKHSHKSHHEATKFKKLFARFLLLTNAVLLGVVVGEVVGILYGTALAASLLPWTRAIELLGEAGADSLVE